MEPAGHKLTHKIDQGRIGQTGVDLQPNAVVGKLGIGERRGVLQFAGHTEDPMVITASLFAFDPTNSGLFFGPLMASIEWGSGHSDMHVAEVDVPATGYSQSTKAADGGIGVQTGGGVIVSVPASSLMLTMRNDGSLIPPIGDLRIGSSATVAKGSAAMAVGNRASGAGSILRRTIWEVSASAGNGLAIAGTCDIVIPPYATAFRIFRSGGSAFQVGITTMQGPGAVIDTINVAANAPCPEIPLTSDALTIHIVNSGGVEITALFALYNISL